MPCVVNSMQRRRNRTFSRTHNDSEMAILRPSFVLNVQRKLEGAILIPAESEISVGLNYLIIWLDVGMGRPNVERRDQITILDRKEGKVHCCDQMFSGWL